uniref:Uncharacterized protein n=1 Tax=viral metagenome TaxID=1070528 RepID=A0A6M3IMS0_9ZZZZ
MELSDEDLSVLKDIRDREIDGEFRLLKRIPAKLDILASVDLIEEGTLKGKICNYPVFVLTFTGHVFLAVYEKKLQDQDSRTRP